MLAIDSSRAYTAAIRVQVGLTCLPWLDVFGADAAAAIDLQQNVQLKLCRALASIDPSGLLSLLKDVDTSQQHYATQHGAGLVPCTWQ